MDGGIPSGFGRSWLPLLADRELTDEKVWAEVAKIDPFAVAMNHAHSRISKLRKAKERNGVKPLN